MADPVADNADFAVDELKRKARRRLVGAIVIALAAATILPLLLEQEQKPLGDDVSVQIPPVDSGKFVSRLTTEPAKGSAPEPRPDAGSIKAATEGAAPAAISGRSAPAVTAAPVPAGAGARGAPDTDADAKAAAPDASARSAGQDAKSEPKGVVKPVPAQGPATSAPPGAPAVPASTSAATPASPAISEGPAGATPPIEAQSAETSRTGAYVVQLGAFTDKYGANALASKLKKQGYPAFTEPVETRRGTLWRVRAGGYPTRPAAVEARNKLKADGHDGVVAAAK